MSVNLIVAVGKDGSIGKNGDLIWKISEDLKHFKSLTTGHPVIMGRKTWDSLPKKPLPGRRNIVLTRNTSFSSEGAETVNSVEKALEITKDEDPFIIGGAEIYNEFLPYVTDYYITEVKDSCDEADAHLVLDLDSMEKINQSPEYSSPEGVIFKYVTYKKKFPDN